MRKPPAVVITKFLLEANPLGWADYFQSLGALCPDASLIYWQYGPQVITSGHPDIREAGAVDVATLLRQAESKVQMMERADRRRRAAQIHFQIFAAETVWSATIRCSSLPRCDLELLTWDSRNSSCNPNQPARWCAAGIADYVELDPAQDLTISKCGNSFGFYISAAQSISKVLEQRLEQFEKDNYESTCRAAHWLKNSLRNTTLKTPEVFDFPITKPLQEELFKAYTDALYAAFGMECETNLTQLGFTPSPPR